MQIDPTNMDSPRITPGVPEHIKLINGGIEAARNRIINETVPSTVELDTDRISGFLEKHDMTMRPFIVVDNENVPSLEQAIGARAGSLAGDTGAYLSTVDLVYVVRDPKIEAVNKGHAVTEATLVHEQTHGNSAHKTIIYAPYDEQDIPSFARVRNGFRVGDQGSFFEEGFAGLMEHLYITEELGLADGLADLDAWQRIGLPDGSFFTLPGSYLQEVGGSALPEPVPAAYAAFGVELLVAKDPGLLRVMSRARQDVDGLREFAARIEALSPGLYRELGSKPYTPYGFIDADRSIIDRLYDGDRRKALELVSELAIRGSLVTQ